MKDLIINGVLIGTDSEGRFSLNDLHLSSGGLNSQKPSLFYRTDNFERFVNILKAHNRAFDPIVKKRGRYDGGTWVCKEIVYKYAMWISPEFEINVIQTFDKVTKISPPKSMIALNELTARIEGNKEAASICGRELAAYRKIKAKDEMDFIDAVNDAQMNLGFNR